MGEPEVPPAARGLSPWLQGMALALVAAAFAFEVGKLLIPATLRGWALGIAGLVPVGVLLSLRRGVGASVAEVPPSPKGRPVLGAVNLALFLGSVAFLRSADIAWADFGRAGPFVVIYSACRVVLALNLLLISCTVGAWLLRRLAPDLPAAAGGVGPAFVLSFFCGATLYALAVTALGAVGLIGLPAALAVTVPVAACAPRVGLEMAGHVRARVRSAMGALRGLQAWVFGLLLWCTAVSALLLLATRGLYPGQTADDVWRHYLHYYREVLATGSLAPNELWYHFHLSKGAGLFFLLGSLSDTLAPQLVTWSFLAVSGLIVYLILRRLTGDPGWALLGTTILFTTYRGDFFKHHDVLTGYLALFLWASIELPECPGQQRRTFLAVAALSAFYVGFYQPMGAVIVGAFWVALTLLYAAVPAWRGRATAIVILLVCLGTGVAVALVCNYAVTGLAELVPFGFFWSFADRERVVDSSGVAGIAYLLYTESDRFRLAMPAQAWLTQALRYHHLRVLFPPAMAGVAALAGLLFLVRRHRVPEGILRPCAVVAALCLPVLGFAVAIRNPSLARLYAFTTAVGTIVLVILYRSVLQALTTGGIRAGAESTAKGFLAVYAVGQMFWYGEEIWGVRMETVGAYLVGHMSVAQALDETDRLFDAKVDLATVAALRLRMPSQAPIVDLGHNPGPGATLPGAGLIDEINHSLGQEHAEAVFGTPSQARQILERHGWDYFLYDLRNAAVSSLIYGELFSPGEFDGNFRVVFQQGDTYLLTWRGTNTAEDLPPRLRQAMELARTEAVCYPATDALRADLDALVESEVGRGEGYDPRALGRGAASLVRRGMGRVVLPENRDLVDVILARVDGTTPVLAAELDVSVRRWVVSTGVPEAQRVEAYRRELARLLQRSLVLQVRHAVAERFGEEVAEALTTGNPLAPIYRSRRQLEEIVGVRTAAP